MTNKADPDRMTSLIWIYTVCKGKAYPGSAGQGLISQARYITKTYLYNFDPVKPHFYTVKLLFTGVFIIFLISAQNIDCGYTLEPPRRGGSNEYHNLCFE